ncbi:MAG: sigma-54-dependent Fis family transcriptional regulator [Candidatus Sabulitectum sp.]|nr:sigma-54-dependent Fis family transcriptional regulator [Candidatus Sabulitectum sp.]
MDKKKLSILLVDDEESMVEWLSILLEQDGYKVNSFSHPEAALKWSEQNQVHVLISDIKMPAMSGLELFAKVREIHPHMAGIFMTAFSSVDTAVKAVRQGASDYLLKPFKTGQMLAAIEKAVREKKITAENRALKQKLSKEYNFQGIIGRSQPIIKLLEMVRKVADQPSTVLISGESGTGKELIAKAIHNNSIRRDDPFIGINCGSLSPNLLESELFGHRKGSFTGAYRDKEGLMIASGRGTLFLDEIGELNKDLQVKLLRAIQERQVRPVGDTATRPFRGRLICASNRDLEEMVQEGTFRNDLFYRLNVLPLHVPPLRERREDIPLLVKHFLENGNYPGKEFSVESLEVFTEYNWPGNVRELQNIVERVCVLSSTSTVQVAELPGCLMNKAEKGISSVYSAGIAAPGQEPVLPTLSEIEKAWTYYILEKKAGGEKRAASKILGINEATLHRRLQRYKTEDE